jgi:chemotaxis methyl-accepting protein methylase
MESMEHFSKKSRIWVAFKDCLLDVKNFQEKTFEYINCEEVFELFSEEEQKQVVRSIHKNMTDILLAIDDNIEKSEKLIKFLQ